MTDNEKIPYLQCLYHTGKKVYKWWLVTLGIIGIIIGLGFVIASAWKQIVDFYTTIGNALGYAENIIISFFTNAWSLACAVPWYWWISAGVTIGPLILVAIYCALKHYNIDSIKNTILSAIILISIIALYGICNLVATPYGYATNFDMVLGVFGSVWIIFMLLMRLSDDNN